MSYWQFTNLVQEPTKAYSSLMHWRRYWILFLLSFLLAGSLASRAFETPALIANLGTSETPLAGPWQFHIGDNQAWAAPEYPDADWEQLTTDKPWDDQGHRDYDGFGWYRRAIRFSSLPVRPAQLALFVPAVGDACEIYWNGTLVGRSGSMPPHPDWYIDSSTTAQLDTTHDGVLAIRVWRAPYLSIGWNDFGGLRATPLVGLPEEIAARSAERSNESFRYDVSYIILFPLYALAALLGITVWLGDRSKTAYIWMSCFSLAMLAMLLVNIPLGWKVTEPLLLSINRAGFGVRDISLWYMLLWLLDLRGTRVLARTTGYAARFILAVVAAYAALLILAWPSAWTREAQLVEGVLAPLFAVPGFLSLAIVAIALSRVQKLSASRWILAIATVLTQLLVVARNLSIIGLRFTHWPLIGKLLTPLAVVKGMAIHQHTVTDTLVLAALVYAFYRDSVEDRRRHQHLQQEFRNARELQQVLIPENLPDIPGYALTSAYRPALEVGGDYFQIIPREDQSTLVILGDVSGKGLKAAMAVSMIVGSIRALVDDYPEPARLLETLNARLQGRLQGAFSTCIALRLHPGGKCAIATAGHPPPFLNAVEMELPGAFPLGLIATATYEEFTKQLNVGDQLALYTDGLLEAMSPSGELFGFERLKTLFAERPSAEQAAEAAVCFGQDDDITVLTLTVQRMQGT